MSHDFLKCVLSLPQQILEGVRIGKSVRVSSPTSPRFCTVILCGVGGSALPGLLLRQHVMRADWKSPSEIIIHRNYGLPHTIRHKPAAVICVSYSGNTEEALSSYREARRRHLPLFVVASGGILARWAERDRLPIARIPQDATQPRLAIGYQFGALVGLFVTLRLLSPFALRGLLEAAKQMRPMNLKPQGRTLARKLYGRIPVIYAGEANATLAYIWKIQMNENAKIPSFTNTFPELNHNEFNAYIKLSPLQSALHKSLAVVILRDSLDLPRIQKRMDITTSLVQENGTPTINIALPGSTSLLRTFNAIVLGNLTSGFLAERYAVNPLPVDFVEKLKLKLKRKPG